VLSGHETQCRYGISRSSFFVPGGVALIESTIPIFTYISGAAGGAATFRTLVSVRNVIASLAWPPSNCLT
jgi:hypothetical protein